LEIAAGFAGMILMFANSALPWGVLTPAAMALGVGFILLLKIRIRMRMRMRMRRARISPNRKFVD
jgi:hypothetical protein